MTRGAQYQLGGQPAEVLVDLFRELLRVRRHDLRQGGVLCDVLGNRNLLRLHRQPCSTAALGLKGGLRMGPTPQMSSQTVG